MLLQIHFNGHYLDFIQRSNASHEGYTSLTRRSVHVFMNIFLINKNVVPGALITKRPINSANGVDKTSWDGLIVYHI